MTDNTGKGKIPNRGLQIAPKTVVLIERTGIMTELRRRQFLTGSASGVLLSRMLPVAPFVFVLPTEARAWVVAALAAGSVVAGAIAAHNQGDGGIGAMLGANYELLKAALTKLQDIQTRLGGIYQRLEELKDEIDASLKRETTRKLQIEMLAVVRGYHEKLTNKDPDQPFSDWKSDSLTKIDLGQLLARLTKARQEINVQELVDPSTALVAATTGFVETNLKNLLGYRTPEIVGTVDNIYLPWLDDILNPARLNSAAHYSEAAAARLQNLYAEILKHPLGSALTLNPGSSALMACTGVHDYTPERTITRPRRCPPVNFIPDVDQYKLPHVINVSGSKELAMMCEDTRVVAARNGPNERLSVSVSLSESEYIDGNVATGVLVLALQQGAELRAALGSSGLPVDDSCEKVTEDIQSEAKRLERMRQLPSRVEGEKRFQELSRLIDAVNMERSRIAYGVRTMTACEVAKRNLVELKRRYSM